MFMFWTVLFMITSTNHYVFTLCIYQSWFHSSYDIVSILLLFWLHDNSHASVILAILILGQELLARVTLCPECRHNPVLSKHMLIGWLNHYQAGSWLTIDCFKNTVIHTSGSLSHPKMNAGCDHLPEGGNMPSCSGSLVLSSVHMLINLEVIFPITLFQYGCYLVTW